MKKKTPTRKSAKKLTTKFGGRSTATGVGYESQIAASIAVKMLAGDRCIVWDGVNGGDIAAITMQDAEPVDDVVVTLSGQDQFKAFISAKHREGSISISAKSSAFCDVVSSFVKQFQKLTTSERLGSQLMWGIPSSAGIRMTQHLREALDTFRKDDHTSIDDFLKRRSTKEKEVFQTLIEQTKRDWKSVTKETPTETELSEFLEMVHVAVFDFGFGFVHDRAAEETIREILAVKPNESHRIWSDLELHFNRANRKGIKTTSATLRQSLKSDELTLLPTPNFADDIELLQDLTSRNLDRLEQHTLLKFKKGDVHIPRTEELTAMITAAKKRHLLVTGEPGSGKSGLIHPLAQALTQEGIPVVLLLAEEVFGRDWKGSANIPHLKHTLDQVLSQWPDGKSGVFITDALDAVRDTETQSLLRRMLQDVQQGSSGWTVVASVREFDLKYGRELRDSFPGDGVPGNKLDEFKGISHFHVKCLDESALDELVKSVPEIEPFITSARRNPRAGSIHRSPFFLRLASELLKNGVSPSRLADWSSPAILLRRFWESRVMERGGASQRKVALQSICRRMTELRSLTISTQEVQLSASDLDAIDELRSRGILQSPVLRYGSTTGDDTLQFSHHLLHDYIVARAMIPSDAGRFAEFTIRESLLPIFYRQSFLFALEELWDGSDGREGFWNCALKMESVAQLHGITRILAPLLASRRVDEFPDLKPLFTAIEKSKDDDSPAGKALRHMASSLQDADDTTIIDGASAWATFGEKLSSLLVNRPSLETPLVHILARLKSVSEKLETEQLHAINSTACRVLAYHVSKDVSKSWRYGALTAIESICRTFMTSESDSESALKSLLTPQRLSQFPHYDLFDFANALKHLGAEGDPVILSLFDAAFSTEPTKGEWENFGGSAIMPLRMQNSDNWNSIHHSLADYYETRDGESAGFMTKVACIAWDAVQRRKSNRHQSDDNVIGTFHFRDTECQLIEDHGHISGREFEHDENRILSHFETLLNTWADSGDLEKLSTALDCLLKTNQPSILWTVFIKIGANYPATLGKELESLLFAESLFLTHFDYSYAGTSLLAALHQHGSDTDRERLENVILNLPKTARLRKDETREPTPDWLIYAQDRLLGSLDQADIISTETIALRLQRAEEGSLPINRKPEPIRALRTSIPDDEFLELQGTSLKDPVNALLHKLKKDLKSLHKQDDIEATVTAIEESWSHINECENAVNEHRSNHDEMASELLGELVSTCNSLAQQAEWPATDERWKTVRRILLAASIHELPKPSEENESDEEDSLSWGTPAPRLDSAIGLLRLTYKLGNIDSTIEAALLSLGKDCSYPLRYNLAERLAYLERTSPELMWRIVDDLIEHEKKFLIIVAVIHSLDFLIKRSPQEVKLRFSRITERVTTEASEEHCIHKHLASSYLFYFLRTGDTESEAYIGSLISQCDTSRANKALIALLHPCRDGGWLTVGDGVTVVELEEIQRKRTWAFFEQLLDAAQTALKKNRDLWERLHRNANPDDVEKEAIQKTIRLTFELVDGITTQLYFASGAFADKMNKDEDHLTEPQKNRFWQESSKLFKSLSTEIHPHTAHYLVGTLDHLLPCSPKDAFLTATSAILSSSTAGYQHESIAVGDVVKLIQHALADHREIFQNIGDEESDCLTALLKVLDIFVEAGWAEARQLTHRLEEIYR